MSSDDKGKFATHIGDEVIKAALESVRKHTGEAAPDLTPSGGTPAAGAGVEVKVEVEGEAPAEAAAPAATSKEIESLNAQLELSQTQGRKLMDRIKDEHEKMLRAAADLENYKKRAAKEKEETQKFGNEKILKDLLPVVDNFDRALEHSKAGGDLASLEKGVQMVRKLLEDTLAKHGIKAFESKGKPFDPNVHEAMQQIETDELPPNHVMGELVRGFTLNDRLVRPALVMVSKAKAAAAEAKPEASKPEDEPKS